MAVVLNPARKDIRVTLKDLGAFLNFDGADELRKAGSVARPIAVDLWPVSSDGLARCIPLLTDLLPRDVQATKRTLEFSLTVSPHFALSLLAGRGALASVPVVLRWNGRNERMLKKAVAELGARGLLREVVLLLSPACVESLDRLMLSLASLGAHKLSLQMEYARPWTLYDYFVLEQIVRRLDASAWRIGKMTVCLGEPMCRRPRHASYCGAGATKVAIGEDGMLYPCHRFLGDRRRVIGTVGLGFWPGVLGLHRYRPDQNVDCRDCPLVPRCDAGCIWLNLRETGRMDRTTSAVCEFTKMLCAPGGRSHE